MTDQKKLMIEAIQRPRGTRDVFGDEWGYIEKLHRVAQEAFRRAGYGRVSTPALEDTRLFQRGVGEATDIVAKEMYTFEDQGGHSLTLKPEQTAPVVRAYLENGWASLPVPLRLSYFETNFRRERPQEGRYRQFYILGVEVIGDGAPPVDAEVIALAWRIYRGLGLEQLSLQLGSVGCSVCRPKYIKELTAYYEGRYEEICEDCRTRLALNPLRLLDCKEDAGVAAEAPQLLDHLCRDCHQHFAGVLEHLDELELPYELNPRLVRGLDYYTRTTFEIWGAREGAQSAICGGGRYDGLIELLGGRATPAIGFSGGIERAVLEMREQGVAPDPTEGVEIYVAQIGETARKRVFRLLHELLDAGIGAVANMGKDSIKAQLKEADRIGAGMTVIIGQKEVYESTVIIRDMKTGVQDVIPSDEIVAELARRLNRKT
jgi:histidyl-tRNA synthetase